MINNFYEPHETRPIKSAARGEQRSILRMEAEPLAAFVIACFIGLAILFHFDDASAQEAEVIAGGELEYQKYCAVCHGVDARGAGIMAKFLTIRPADLTQIATRNGGTFPFWQIYRVIDGGEVRGHGSRDMPIWGDRFRTQAGGNDPGSRAQAAGRLLGLVFYLQHIQQ